MKISCRPIVSLFVGFLITCPWSWWGEKARRSGKKQFESKVRTPNEDLRKRGQKPDTEQVRRPAGGRQ